MFLTKVLGRIVPEFTLDSGIKFDMLSRDPTVAAAVDADPLCHTLVTAGWGLAMLRTVALVFEKAPQYALTESMRQIPYRIDILIYLIKVV